MPGEGENTRTAIHLRTFSMLSGWPGRYRSPMSLKIIDVVRGDDAIEDLRSYFREGPGRRYTGRRALGREKPDPLAEIPAGVELGTDGARQFVAEESSADRAWNCLKKQDDVGSR
jgi:hypothetical protein